MSISLAARVDRAVRLFGARTAVVDGDRTLTFDEIGRRSDRLANALRHIDPAPGSRVAILLGNRLEYIELELAIVKTGKVKAPVNTKLTEHERGYILANLEATIVVTERSELESTMELVRQLPHVRGVVCADAAAAGALGYEDILAAASAAPTRVDVRMDAPAVVLHTSGTTGKPKGATASYGSRLAATRSMLLDEFAVRPDDGMVHVAPLAHGSGSKALAYFLRGARNIVLPRFDPGVFIDVVAGQGGTSSFMVPTMIRMLLDEVRAAGRDLSGLRNLTYGAAPMPVSLLEEGLETLGNVFVQVYGSCEAPHPVTVLSREAHRRDATADGGHLSSAGREVLDVEVRIAADDGAEVEPGDVGEMLLRGENVMTGYWNDPAATAEVLSDGWYRSGDMGRRDADGFIHIVDRKRNLIISGGLNIYPAEIEAILDAHPAVRESCVIGLPDEHWGETVAAFVQLQRGARLDADEVVAHCRQYLASYKKPHVVRFVDELPKGPTGKNLKDALRASYLHDPSTRGPR